MDRGLGGDRVQDLGPGAARDWRLRTIVPQQFSLWARWASRVRAPGLQDGGFTGDVGRVPSPGLG
jgi:hypothetical protein